MAKPKSKTQKKIDNTICKALTEACSIFLAEVEGFEWLTHRVNYTNFPASLIVTCVFDTKANQQQAESAAECLTMQKQIQAKLLKVGVKFKVLSRQVVFDNEQACLEGHEGDWELRLARH